MRFFLDLLALIFGVLLTFSFAPFHLWPIAIVSPAALLFVWIYSTPIRSFWRGWLFGIGFFSTSVYWIFISLHSFGSANIFFASLATACLILFLGLFFAVPGYCFTRFFPKNNWTKLTIIFPLLWVLFEWLRAWALTGFPWVLLGYSQTDSPLRGLAPILSVYGVTWATCFTAAIFVYLSYAKPKAKIIFMNVILLLSLWVGSDFLTKINWTKPAGKSVTVSLIQGDIPQSLKWNEEQFLKTLEIYSTLTNQHWKSDIIVWPEAAITLTQIQTKPFLTNMSSLAKKNNSAIITGIPIAKDKHYYNGMIVLGNGKGIYLKRHLVPFGEYLPLRAVFKFFGRYVQIPMSDFSSGKTNQGPFVANGISFSPYICYEIIYPEEVKNTLGNAQVIVVLTDDSWFGKSIANAQHLQMTQMRAIETGRDILLSTNDGITAIINAKGRIVKRLPPYQRAVLTGKFQPMTGKTLWMKF